MKRVFKKNKEKKGKEKNKKGKKEIKKNRTVGVELTPVRQATRYFPLSQVQLPTL